LRGRTLLNYKGIDFNNSFQTTAPSSTHLWTNSSNRLFYGSDAVILNDGNNTGAVGSPLTIGTINASNLQLETNNTTRVFISGSGNVGIGINTPESQLHISGANAIMTLSPIDPLPTTNVPSASFATSGSGANLKPYFWNGSTWTALF